MIKKLINTKNFKEFNYKHKAIIKKINKIIIIQIKNYNKALEIQFRINK